MPSVQNTTGMRGDAIRLNFLRLRMIGFLGASEVDFDKAVQTPSDPEHPDRYDQIKKPGVGGKYRDAPKIDHGKNEQDKDFQRKFFVVQQRGDRHQGCKDDEKDVGYEIFEQPIRRFLKGKWMTEKSAPQVGDPVVYKFLGMGLDVFNGTFFQGIVLCCRTQWVDFRKKSPMIFEQVC